LLAKDLYGKEVIGKGGTNIGKVEDVVIELSDWHVSAVKVKLEGNVAEELNLKKHFGSSYFLLGVDHIQGVSDRIVLKSAVEDLIKLVTSPKTSPEQQESQQPATTTLEPNPQ
jgi:sporulation protein YlmC with PRC-barrel domain